MTLMAQDKAGITDLMKKVNIFMEFNNVIINNGKSSYHWMNDDEADLST